MADEGISPKQERTIFSFLKKYWFHIVVIGIIFLLLSFQLFTQLEKRTEIGITTATSLIALSPVIECEGRDALVGDGRCIPIPLTGSGGGPTVPKAILFAFPKLTDTPSSYTGFASFAVTVNSDENGLEFTTTSDLNHITDSTLDTNTVARNNFLATTHDFNAPQLFSADVNILLRLNVFDINAEGADINISQLQSKNIFLDESLIIFSDTNAIDPIVEIKTDGTAALFNNVRANTHIAITGGRDVTINNGGMPNASFRAQNNTYSLGRSTDQFVDLFLIGDIRALGKASLFDVNVGSGIIEVNGTLYSIGNDLNSNAGTVCDSNNVLTGAFDCVDISDFHLDMDTVTTDTTIDTNQDAFTSVQTDLNNMYIQIIDTNNTGRLDFPVIANHPADLDTNSETACDGNSTLSGSGLCVSLTDFHLDSDTVTTDTTLDTNTNARNNFLATNLLWTADQNLLQGHFFDINIGNRIENNGTTYSFTDLNGNAGNYCDGNNALTGSFDCVSLTNFHPQNITGKLNVSDYNVSTLVGSTFGSGDYVFPSSLTINLDLNLFFGQANIFDINIGSGNLRVNNIIYSIADDLNSNAFQLCDLNEALTGANNCIDLTNFHIDNDTITTDSTLDTNTAARNNFLATNSLWIADQNYLQVHIFDLNVGNRIENNGTSYSFGDLNGNAGTLCDGNSALTGDFDCVSLTDFHTGGGGGTTEHYTAGGNLILDTADDNKFHFNDANYTANPHDFSDLNVTNDLNTVNIRIFDGNLYITEDFGICLNQACTKFITYNGEAIVIQS